MLGRRAYWWEGDFATGIARLAWASFPQRRILPTHVAICHRRQAQIFRHHGSMPMPSSLSGMESVDAKMIRAHENIEALEEVSAFGFEARPRRVVAVHWARASVDPDGENLVQFERV